MICRRYLSLILDYQVHRRTHTRVHTHSVKGDHSYAEEKCRGGVPNSATWKVKRHLQHSRHDADERMDERDRSCGCNHRTRLAGREQEACILKHKKEACRSKILKAAVESGPSGISMTISGASRRCCFAVASVKWPQSKLWTEKRTSSPILPPCPSSCVPT
jgi:hypothetical protein